MRRFIGPTILTLALGMGAVKLLKESADAREVAGETVWNLFRFFTTPFIMEFSLIVGGLLAVTTFNQWRRSKDGPDWVEMEVSTVDEPVEDKSASTH